MNGVSKSEGERNGPTIRHWDSRGTAAAKSETESMNGSVPLYASLPNPARPNICLLSQFEFVDLSLSLALTFRQGQPCYNLPPFATQVRGKNSVN
jgi:hypothetical protein